MRLATLFSWSRGRRFCSTSLDQRPFLFPRRPQADLLLGSPSLLLLTNYPGLLSTKKSEVLFVLGFFIGSVVGEKFGAKSVRRRRPHHALTKREERGIVDKRWGNLSTMGMVLAKCDMYVIICEQVFVIL